jgi:hypothetical protein
MDILYTQPSLTRLVYKSQLLDSDSRKQQTPTSNIFSPKLTKQYQQVATPLALNKHLLVLILLQLPNISLPSIAREATQLDIDGHELSSDSSYYIVPADKKNGLRNFLV